MALFGIHAALSCRGARSVEQVHETPPLRLLVPFAGARFNLPSLARNPQHMVQDVRKT